ncbi:MAG TPA: recombinase family protein [Alphaproteobacteria bacterium]
MAIIGYIRTSNAGDDQAAQLAALSNLPCSEIFRDNASFRNDGSVELQGLALALEHVRDGDILAVARLDRFGRSLSRTIATVNELLNRGVGFISVAEAIDTTSDKGAEVRRLFQALSRVEGGVFKKNGRAGLVAANSRGRPSVITPEKFKIAQSLIESGLTVRAAALRIEVSKSVLYDALKASPREADGLVEAD